MDSIFEFLNTLVKVPQSLTKFLVIVLVLGSVAVFIVPVVYNNFFYLKSVKQKAEIVEDLSNIPSDRLKNDPSLKSQYETVLDDLEKLELHVWKLNLNGVVSYSGPVSNWGKFLSGFSLWILFSVIFIFDKKNSIGKKIGSILVLLIVGAIFGGVGMLIPIIYSPWVNYIGYPALQLVVLIILVVKFSNNKKKKD